MKNFQGDPPSDTILFFMQITTKSVGYTCQSVMMVTTHIPRFSLKVVFCHFVRISCSVKFVRTCSTPMNTDAVLHYFAINDYIRIKIYC